MTQGQNAKINYLPCTFKEKVGNKILEKAILWKGKFNEKQISSYLGWIEGIRVVTGGHKGTLGVMEMFQVLNLVIITWCAHLVKLIKSYNYSGFLLFSISFCVDRVSKK